jgi:hypothetical protein
MFVDLVPISKIDVENILSNFSSGFFIVINFPKARTPSDCTAKHFLFLLTHYSLQKQIF